jgi:hypothetical protein
MRSFCASSDHSRGVVNSPHGGQGLSQRRWPAKRVPLELIAARSPEKPGEVFVLDAFSDDPDVQSLGELDQARNKVGLSPVWWTRSVRSNSIGLPLTITGRVTSLPLAAPLMPDRTHSASLPVCARKCR